MIDYLFVIVSVPPASTLKPGPRVTFSASTAILHNFVRQRGSAGDKLAAALDVDGAGSRILYFAPHQVINRRVRVII